jgi:hypothetical protein
MPDNRADRGKQDRERINVSEDHELRYWSTKFGCTKEELVAVVKRVGPMAKDVERAIAARGDATAPS